MRKKNVKTKNATQLQKKEKFMEKVLWLFKRVKSGLRISMEISLWMMH